jgi:hypothetical protein
MNDFFNTLTSGDFGASYIPIESMLLAMVLAFCMGHVIGWVYMFTHVGLSYSQMFVGSLVVIPTLVSLTMVLMAGDIIVAFGLFAIFAIVRFRNVLKDTRDTTFMMWAILQGMAAGTLKFGLAIISCLAISAIFLYLRGTAFGSRHRYDIVVSLQSDTASFPIITPILRRHALRIQVASQRELPDQAIDLSYRLLLRDPRRSQDLLSELQATNGLSQVSLYHRSDEAEV